MCTGHVIFLVEDMDESGQSTIECTAKEDLQWPDAGFASSCHWLLLLLLLPNIELQLGCHSPIQTAAAVRDTIADCSCI